MATKKNASKPINQKTRNKKSKKGILNVLGVLLVIVIIAIVGFLGFQSYQKSVIVQEDIDKVLNDFDVSIPKTTLSNIELVTTTSEYLCLEWVSDNKTYLDIDGTVVRPNYQEGNKSVNFGVTITVGNIRVIDEIFFGLFGVDLVTECRIKVTITALEMTSLDKVNHYLELLELPKTVYTSIGLPQGSAIYDGLTVVWSTNQANVINQLGIKKGTGTVTMTATVSYLDQVKEKSFEIEVLDELDIYEIDSDFYHYDKTSYANSIEYQGLTITNAISDQEKLKFRLNSELSTIDSKLIHNLKTISFSYEYNEASKGDSYTKNTFVNLYVSTDGVTYQLVKSEILADSFLHTFTYRFEGAGYYIKIVISTEYAANSRFVLVDDLKIVRGLDSSDIIESLSRQIPNQVKSSIELPKTTNYGGIVSYATSNSNFSILGKVVRLEQGQEITLTIQVDGFHFPVTFEKKIKISSLTEVVQVEIRFIDVGKYGQSDCGESIYIKYGDIDILIDAGDDYAATVKAIKEIIDMYSNDSVLDYVIATHPDSDHIGSMDNIIKDYVVNNIIHFSGDATSKVVYPNYRDAVEAEECTVCTGVDSYNNVNGCMRIIELGEDVFLEIINTTYYEVADNNSRSIVCVLNAYGVRTLFTGDADNNKYDVEKAYMNAVGDIDILKVVHHGTKNGTTMDFLQVIDPEVAIICNGNYFGNKHGHPTYQAITNLYDYDPNMLVYTVVGGDTDNCTLTTSVECDVIDRFYERNGTITITIDNNGYMITSEYYGSSPLQVKDTSFWVTIGDLVK